MKRKNSYELCVIYTVRAKQEIWFLLFFYSKEALKRVLQEENTI